MTGEERKASPAPLPLFLCLHRLTDDVPDGVGEILLAIIIYEVGSNWAGICKHDSAIFF